MAIPSHFRPFPRGPDIMSKSKTIKFNIFVLLSFQPPRLFGGSKYTNVLQILMSLPPDSGNIRSLIRIPNGGGNNVEPR